MDELLLYKMLYYFKSKQFKALKDMNTEEAELEPGQAFAGETEAQRRYKRYEDALLHIALAFEASKEYKLDPAKDAYIQ